MRLSAILLPILFSAPIFAREATDAELLKWVKERTSLERATPQPVDMPPAVSQLCRPPAPQTPSLHEKATFHVFANPPAVQPLFDPWGTFPEGSLLLKEKFNRETHRTELFTGMWKRELGYFPEAGDWEFFTVNADASKLESRGKLPACASCHEDLQKGDHVSKKYIIPAQLTGGRIMLHSSTAKATGEKLHYEEAEKKNTLGFWVNPADWASWSFQVDRPGTFEIHVWQGCGKDQGGSEVTVTSAGQTATFTVEDTGHFQNFKERIVGKVTYKEPGPQTLEVRVKSKAASAVMDLRQIILVPVARE
ncbi:hypothetical protein llg_00760 [Luteolibacter sp. LG18]|nr:hypothetical protein llg_00760 [Luteolibacter sp. LG18]